MTPCFGKSNSGSCDDHPAQRRPPKMPKDNRGPSGVRATAVFLLLRAWYCEAARPFYEAPLLQPLLAPETLIKWQPAEWSIALAPSSEDPYDPSTNVDDAIVDESLDLIDVSHADVSRGHAAARLWHAFANRARDVSIEPIAAAVAIKREGWTGGSIQSSASFAVANDARD